MCALRARLRLCVCVFIIMVVQLDRQASGNNNNCLPTDINNRNKKQKRNANDLILVHSNCVYIWDDARIRTTPESRDVKIILTSSEIRQSFIYFIFFINK